MATALFLIVYATLYSSLFSNWPGVWDGLYQTLSYWGGQQLKPRLPGPFYYYLPRLILHEPVFYLALAALFYAGFKKASPFDLFLAYWTLASFFIYSLAQEKVPWLLIHILVPMALLAGRMTQIVWNKKRGRLWLFILLALLLSWSLRDSLELVFFSPPTSPHLLKYMATGSDIKEAVKTVRSRKGKPGQIFVTGQAVWPLAWYLRDQFVTYDLLEGWEKTAALVIYDADREMNTPGFTHQRLLLRVWWLPDYGKLMGPGLLPYLWRQEVLQPYGKSYFIMAMKPTKKGN